MNKKLLILITCILIYSVAGAETEIPVVVETKNSELIPTVLTKSQIAQIEKLSIVENIEFVPSFSVALQDSSPLINASLSHTLQQNSVNLTGIDETVCIIDTGIDSTHPSLLGKNKTCVVDCYNKACVENCSIGDDNGHGTHVAGIVASTSGIAKESSIIGIKVLDQDGNSHPTTGSIDIMNALQWCNSNRIRYNISVISMSLGTLDLFGTYCDSSFSSTLTPAINNATQHNISVVSASGNSGSGVPRNTTAISAPACITNSTSVSATDKDDSISSYGHYNNLTDFFAPGTNINSTLAGGGYASSLGTSMSTPHVSAAFALVRQFKRLQENQVLSPSQIKTTLKNHGKNITTPSGFNITRINIYNAIISLDSLAPNVSLTLPVNNQLSPSTNRTFECITTDLSLKNVTFYLWNSSSVFNQTSETISGSSHTLNYNTTNISLGTYNWNCLSYDENGNSAFASSNFTFTVGGISTTLISPTDNNFTNINNTNFTCLSTSEETHSLSNITFYLWNASLLRTETKNLSGTENSTSFNFTFSEEGAYEWNCLSFNNNTNSSFAANNFTITYDATKPNITLSSPSDSYSATGEQTITFHFNVTDNFNITRCELILNDASVSSNTTPIINPNNISYSVSPGSYNWQINCTDQAGNIGNSSYRTLTLNSLPAQTSGSSSGGGGSGSAQIAQTFTPSSTELAFGYTKELKKSDKVKITIFDETTQAHTLTINEVAPNSVNLTIQSTPLHILLGIGQSIKLNITSGDFYDLYIKLESIKSNKAQLTVQTILEQIPKQPKEEIHNWTISENETISGTEREENPEQTQNSRTQIAILVSIILTLLVFIVFYLKSRKEMKKEIIKEVKEDLRKEKNKN